jgi:hypothetical protein
MEILLCFIKQLYNVYLNGYAFLLKMLFFFFFFLIKPNIIVIIIVLEIFFKKNAHNKMPVIFILIEIMDSLTRLCNCGNPIII